MSGIAGIIHFDGQPVETGEVEAMTAAMHYRGPDGIHHWRRANVALGQCMLRTTPESLEETQPLTNEDESLVLVMDGRVDNWEELRRELLGKGAVLRTRADAELVLWAYEVWGRDCLSHIDGDFALVIWDARRQAAFCARDRVGNKPFNYHWNGSTLVFASELHPVLALPWVTEVLDQDTLAEYLAAQWCSTTGTLWQGVLRLDAAHAMVVSQRGPVISRYWAPDLRASLSFRSDEACTEHYRTLLFDVVRRLSRCTTPLACEVSGGLDSSAIFAVAETLHQRGALAAPGLEGYTLDFSGDPLADELAFCRAVGTHLGKAIHEIAPRRMPLSQYQDVARHDHDFPDFPNGGPMGLPIAERARANGSRVLISGLGGDQWLGGSDMCYAEAIAGLRGRELLALLGGDIRAAGWRDALWRVLRFGIVPLLSEQAQQRLRAMYANWRRPAAEAAALDWLAEPMRTRFLAHVQACRRPAARDLARAGQRDQLASLHDAYQLLAIELAERLYARHGLELRQPFWNARIIEFAFATPERSRLRGQVDKWLHRQAMQGLLPANVLQRNDKAEFSSTFFSDRAELAMHLTENVLPRRQQWVRPQAIQRMLQTVGQPDHSAMWVLWALFGVDAAVDDLA